MHKFLYCKYIDFILIIVYISQYIFVLIINFFLNNLYKNKK